MKKRSRKQFHFKVTIADPNDYPDLEKNPTNPFCHMSDEERIDELTDMLGEMWAEICSEKVKKNQSLS